MDAGFRWWFRGGGGGEVTDLNAVNVPQKDSHHWFKKMSDEVQSKYISGVTILHGPCIV